MSRNEFDRSGGGQGFFEKNRGKLILFAVIGILLLIISFATIGSVDPAHGEFYVWRNIMGKELPPGQIIADEGQAGFTRKMHTQGWEWYFFKNITRKLEGPFTVTEVGPGQICTLVQHTGKPLPEGMILAPVNRNEDGTPKLNEMGLPESDYMGMLDEMLGPGQYRVHPKMYTPQLFDWVDVPSNQICILKQNDGMSLPEGMLLAPVERTADGTPKLNEMGMPYSKYRGMLDEYLTPGQYRIHPGKYKSLLVNMSEVKAGEVGVLVRRAGLPLPDGEFIAPIDRNEDGSAKLRDSIPQSRYKGILAEVLKPGQYRVHPGIYEFITEKAVRVMPGEVGVVTALTGKSKPETQLLAKEGERGVQEKVLPAGTYYLNPHMVKVDNFSIQSHLTEFLQDDKAETFDEIDFPSNEGFMLKLDIAVEWRGDENRIPELFVRLGNIKDLQHKVVVPNTRSIARTEGSKYGAKQFIQGATREQFEKAFFDELKEVCAEKGVQIMRGVVRKLTVPEQISEPIRMAEIARQEVLRNKEEVERAKSAALKMEEETRIEQRKQQIDAETQKMVADTNAQQRLSVAKVELDTAKQEAEATKTRGDAEAHVIFAKKKAEADGVRVMTEAFGGGESLARYEMAKAVSANTTFVWLPSNEGTFWGGGGTEGLLGDMTKWLVKDARKSNTDGTEKPVPLKSR